MYQETKGCGCGGGSASAAPTVARTPSTAPARRLGRIDKQGRCVCGQCEECTGLQCLCRPRFFDGQLLTAADLRRLDTYIVQRSRLHNRYLHGVGVVCGLEVVCSRCDNTVTVRPGYALGPCGEDIVVCGDATVDVAGLIKAQRAASSAADCAPFSEPVRQYEAARQQWVLGVCFDERPAAPVTSLKRATSRCRCGGSCGGSCGSSRGSGSANCEPSQICEGYTFTLTKVPAGGASTGAEGLPAAVRQCLDGLRSGLSQLPQQPTTEQLIDYAADLKDQLHELIATGNVHDCTLGQRLNDIVLPDLADNQAAAKATAAIAAMLQLAVELFRECICSALLPACSTGCADDCVPLAVLTVRSSDLQVLEVCNWSARKFAITMPTLSYWLGWLPIFASLRSVIERLCCVPARRPSFAVDDQLKVRVSKQNVAKAAPGRPESDVTNQPSSFVELAQQYQRAWTSLSGLEATVLGALGGRTTADAPLASELELDNPLAALALGRIGVGTVAGVLPQDLVERFSARVERPEAPQAQEAAAHDERLAAMEASLAGLKKTVDTQARTIRTLKAKVADA